MQKRKNVSGASTGDGSLLISEQHRDRYKRHYESRTAVAHSRPWHALVAELAQSEQAASMLDYGCGPGRELSKFMDISVVDYEPAVPGIDVAPETKFDIVVANHVLENVEKEFVDAVLEHLYKLTRKVLFLSVSCNPSKKHFADGTSVPRFARDAEWWITKLTSLFASTEVLDNSESELIVLGRK